MDISQSMRDLFVKMSRSKGESGHVVFIATKGMPVPLPMFGRPEGTHADAEAKAKAQLASKATQAWVVSRGGIVEVTR